MPAPPGPFTVVRVDPSASAPLQLAVQACAGVRNRAVGGSVYVDADSHDAAWLTELSLVPTATVGAEEFLRVVRRGVSRVRSLRLREPARAAAEHPHGRRRRSARCPSTAA